MSTINSLTCYSFHTVMYRPPLPPNTGRVTLTSMKASESLGQKGRVGRYLDQIDAMKEGSRVKSEGWLRADKLQSPKKVCKFFQQYGHCKNGDSCGFEHARHSGRPTQRKVCFDFQNKGACHRGDVCGYDHIEGSKSESSLRADKLQAQLDAMKEGSRVKSESSLRADKLQAQLDAMKEGSRVKSESSLRVNKLQAQLDAMKEGSRVKSESSLRVNKLQAQIAAAAQIDAAKTTKRAIEQSPKKVCKFFQQYGHCKNGDSCGFEHARHSGRPTPRKVCFDFQNKGACHRGDACGYDHIEGSKSESSLRADKLQAQLDAMKEGSRVKSESSLRADKLQAQLDAMKEGSRVKSESSLRADKLQAQLDAMKEGSRVKSESSRRADALEAKLAAMEKQLASKELMAKKKEKEINLKDLELKNAKMFSEIRNDMKSKISDMKIKLKLDYEDANSLDLVILMDCTGSMASFIEEAKNQVTSIIDSLRTTHDNAEVICMLLYCYDIL
jgi:hypothetical protein